MMSFSRAKVDIESAVACEKWLSLPESFVPPPTCPPQSHVAPMLLAEQLRPLLFSNVLQAKLPAAEPNPQKWDRLASQTTAEFVFVKDVIRTLAGNAWLSDEIIYLYVQRQIDVLCSDDDAVVMFHPMFLTMTRSGKVESHLQSTRFVETTKAMRERQELYLFAVNVNSNHWCGIAIDGNDILIYDPLCGRTTVDRLKAMVESHIRPAIPAAANLAAKPEVIQHPRQKDSWSCGVYVAFWMRSILQDWIEFPSDRAAVAFSQTELQHLPYMRMRIMADLFQLE